MIKHILTFTFSLLFSAALFSQECEEEVSIPFSTNETHLTVWNGDEYVPFFIKGMNLGIAVPGTSPGELAATRADYGRWFADIKEGGYNCIRIYTLHYPRFYEVLDSFNLANPNTPLYVLHGLWLEEEVPDYDEDLFFLTDTFDHLAQIAVDAVHGNATIPPRFGKAFGTYRTNISKWVMGYIAGREVFPSEILKTNILHANVTSYNGRYFNIADAEPATTWVGERLDKVLIYENDTYGIQRPISFSSWPTLDPIDHPYDPAYNYLEEDTAHIDLTRIDFSNAPAGLFASFHAYPYYPPFVSKQPDYQDATDYLGTNSYLGYIQELRDYHEGMPMVIAEFGTPSSWGSASFSSSGMDHGGMSELQAGLNGVRMFRNMFESQMAGGCYFSWIDEWFKRTWIVDEFDYPLESRQRWHNKMAAEQNFGLLGYEDIGFQKEELTSFNFGSSVQAVDVAASYAFFHADLHLNQSIGPNDTLWVGLDTYEADLGESILPNGTRVNNRLEFALGITQDSAKLYVTQAYDIYGIYWGLGYITHPGQLYESTVTDGSPWVLQTWRNDELDEDAVQYIGNIGVTQQGQPGNSLTGVTIGSTKIEIKLPWSIINFIDPTQHVVMHDDHTTDFAKEGRESDGIAISISFKDQLLESNNRFKWDAWGEPTNIREYKKESFFVMQRELSDIQNPILAKCDFYEIKQNTTSVISRTEGVLSNDVLLDGTELIAQIVGQPQNGTISFSNTGAFTYTPKNDYLGEDNFTYTISTGNGQTSNEIDVNILVVEELSPEPDPDPNITEEEQFIVFPNPSSGNITLDSFHKIEFYEIYDSMGKMVKKEFVNAISAEVNTESLRDGIYWATAYSGDYIMTRKFIIDRID